MPNIALQNLSKHNEKQMNITVYLSSKSGIGENFENAVAELGTGIGRMGATLVYGGSNAGQMHRLAARAKQAGATVVGVIPEIFRHLADPVADEMIFTADLCERKAKLFAMGDVFVALPGGIGTLDEIMSTLAEMTVAKDFGKRIFLVNTDGIFTPLLDQLARFAETGLASPEAVKTVIAVESAESCINQINQLNKERL